MTCKFSKVAAHRQRPPLGPLPGRAGLHAAAGTRGRLVQQGAGSLPRGAAQVRGVRPGYHYGAAGSETIHTTHYTLHTPPNRNGLELDWFDGSPIDFTFWQSSNFAVESEIESTCIAFFSNLYWRHISCQVSIVKYLVLNSSIENFRLILS